MKIIYTIALISSTLLFLGCELSDKMKDEYNKNNVSDKKIEVNKPTQDKKAVVPNAVTIVKKEQITPSIIPTPDMSAMENEEVVVEESMEAPNMDEVIAEQELLMEEHMEEIVSENGEVDLIPQIPADQRW